MHTTNTCNAYTAKKTGKKIRHILAGLLHIDDGDLLTLLQPDKSAMWFVECSLLEKSAWSKLCKVMKQHADCTYILLMAEATHVVPKSIKEADNTLLISGDVDFESLKPVRILVQRLRGLSFIGNGAKQGSEMEALHEAIEYIDDMVWVFDQQFRIVTANDSARQFTYIKTGIALQDEMPVQKLFPPEPDMQQIAEWRKLFARAINGERVTTTLALLGQALPFCSTVLYRKVLQNRTVIIAVVRDMGVNVKFISSGELAGSVKGVSILTDVLFFFNKKREVVGFRVEDKHRETKNFTEFLGKNISAVLPVDLCEAWTSAIDSAFATEQIQILQYSMLTDNQVHYFEAKISRLDEANVVAFIRDLTSQRSAELQSYENAKRFLLMLKHTGQILYDYDIRTGAIKWFGNTDSIEKLSGTPSGKLTYADWQSMMVGEDRSMVAIKRKIAEEMHSNFHIEYRLMSVDGKIKTFEDKGAFLYDERGSSYRVLGTVNDITVSKETHDALQKSEERYKAFIAQSTEAIWCFELPEPISITTPVAEQIEIFFERGFLSDGNRTYARMLGENDISSIIGLPLSTILVKEDEANILYLRNFIENGYMLEDAESTEVDLEGNRKYFLNNLVGVVRDGKLERAWGTQRDITHIKEAEQAKKAAEKRYRDIFDNAIEGIYQSSFEGFFLNINPAMASMYGYETPFEMMQRIKNIGLQCYDSAGERVKFLALITKKGRVEGFESIAVKKDGSRFWISENARMVTIEVTGEMYVEGLVEDITRRKVAIQNLSEREELYRSLVDRSPDGIAVYTSDVVMFVNHAGFELLGAQKAEDVIGRHPLDFIHPEDQHIAIDRMKVLLEHQKDVPPIEEKFIRLDGRIVSVEVSAMAISWGGQPAVQVILRDLSGRKREEFIRDSEGAVFTMLAQPIPLAGIFNKICEMNDAFYDNCHTVIYLNMRDSLSISAAPSIDKTARKKLEALEQSGLAGTSVNFKMPFFISDLSKEPQWENYGAELQELGYRTCWARPIMDMKKNVYGVLVYYFKLPTISNLENERIAEHFVNLAIVAIEKRKLEEENFNLSLVARQTTSAVSILGNDFKTIWVNEGFEKLTGYKVDEVKGQFSAELLHGPATNGALTFNAIEELSHTGMTKYETFNYAKNGRGYWVSVLIEKMFDAKNQHIGYFMIENDITERVHHEEAIREAQKRAEDASRLKSTFLANMSHEIRTPMNGILGFADILRSELIEAGNEELYKFSETIYNSGKRLLNLLNDILDLSRIEADKLEVELHECRLDEILLKTITLLKPLAERKGLQLDYSGIQKLFILADENRLHQVFNNIIGNAIKFTPSGSVTILTRILETENGQKQAEILVKDTGRGIEEEFLKIIFEPFMQESTGFSRSHEGSGLGLAISKRLVNLMNGEIFVDSVLREGTTVTVRVNISDEQFFPIIESKSEDDLTKEFAALVKRRPKVFIVEDDETSRALFEKALRVFADVRSASNGDAALEFLSELHKKEWKPNIVLMDIGLPIPWDGVKLRNEILNRFSHLQDTPIVAQTAYAMREEKHAFLQKGFASVLTKPLNRREVLETINHYTTEV